LLFKIPETKFRAMTNDRSNTWSPGFNKLTQLGREAFVEELPFQKTSRPEIGPEVRQTSDGVVKKEEDWPKYAIPLKDFTRALGEARQQGRIDPYQAYLLLAVNCNRLPDADSSHPFQFIALHNDGSLGFPQKIDVLKSQLRAAKVTDDIRAIFGGLTMDNIIVPSMGYRPSYNDGERQAETERGLLWNSRSGTYSAIPKDVFLPMISRAMHDGSMNNQQAAMLISVNCHSLQRRRTGGRYIDHIMAVSAAEELTPVQRCVTLLHDVIEDSNYTLEDLAAVRLLWSIIAGVDGVTIRPGEGYSDFIMRCSMKPNSRASKKVDTKHNFSTDPKGKKVVYPVTLGYMDAIDAELIQPGDDLEEWAKKAMPLESEAYLAYQARKAAEKAAKSKHFNFRHLTWPFGS
jgi:hypothetical protein